MVQQPVPDLLHRVAIQPTELGGLRIEPGTRVAVSLAAAASQGADPAFLFGGDYAAERRHPPERRLVHACPGKEMAIGVLLGATVAILNRTHLRRESILMLSFQ